MERKKLTKDFIKKLRDKKAKKLDNKEMIKK